MRLGILGYSKLSPSLIEPLLERIILTLTPSPREIIHSGLFRPVGETVIRYFKDNPFVKLKCVSPIYKGNNYRTSVLANNLALVNSCDAFVIIWNGYSRLDQDLISQGIRHRRLMWEIVLNYDETLYTEKEILSMATFREISNTRILPITESKKK